jgi:hypothetical protein
MATTTFDTMAYAKRFKAAGFTEQQAEEVVTALREVRDSRLDELATKGDVESAKAELKRDMKEMELRMVVKMGAMILASVGMIIGYLRAFPMPVQIVQPPAQELRLPAPAPAVPSGK